MQNSAQLIDTKQLPVDDIALPIEQLPSVEPEFVAAFNSIYCCRPMTFDNLYWHWCMHTDQRPRYHLVLSSGDECLQINLNSDIINPDQEVQDWLQYRGQIRLCAWTMMHEVFIQLLQVLTGDDWIPESIEPTTKSLDSNERNSIVASFLVKHKNGCLVTTGSMLLPLSRVEKITHRTHLEQYEIPNNTLSMDWHQVGSNLSCTIDTFEVSQQELQALVKGSVIRLNNYSLIKPKPRINIHLGNKTLLGEWHGLQINIIDIVPYQKTGAINNINLGDTPTMNNHVNTPATIEQSSNQLVGEAIPVTLRFEAGQINSTLAELHHIRTGYIFELDKKLEDRLITIYANETAIARGQLISINDFVGVRVTEACVTT